MTRAALHQLLDEVPETQIDRIAELIRAIHANDRVGIQLALAPEVEPEPDELELLAEITEEDRSKTESLETVCATEGWK